MPKLYNNKNSPMYDKLRSKLHQPPKTIILDYNEKSDKKIRPEVQIEDNLSIMYKQMYPNDKTAEQFLGCPLRGGENPETGAGSIENIPHNSVHNWTSSADTKNGEDMGALYAVGRDPIFFAHHANVDRIWFLWSKLGGKRANFKDKDWLESGFVFHNENKELVRVYIKDCLDTRNLGYVHYQTVPLPWKDGIREKVKASSVIARALRK